MKVFQSEKILRLKLIVLSVITLFVLFILVFIVDEIEYHVGMSVIDELGSDGLILLLGTIVYTSLASYISLQWKHIYCEINRGEIVFYDGVIFKKRRVYALENLESVTSYQDIIGKWLNYGTIELHKRFESNNETILYVKNPEKVQEAIEKASDIRERLGKKDS